MTSEHTPGPWNTPGWIHDADGCPILANGLVVATARYLGGTEPAAANARLIAAAPDMLAALQALIKCDEELDLHAYDYLHDYDYIRTMIAGAEAAIVKATGTS